MFWGFCDCWKVQGLKGLEGFGLSWLLGSSSFFAVGSLCLSASRNRTRNTQAHHATTTLLGNPEKGLLVWALKGFLYSSFRAQEYAI